MYLKPPENDIVNAGIAVIDSGPYAGQRLEFEADQCYLFGFSLSNADLSYLFNKGTFQFFKYFLARKFKFLYIYR